jgi:anti-sigma B factor antagonist
MDMTLQRRAVTVKHLPEALSSQQARLFLREVGSSMTAARPCIVLDCSRLRQLNISAIHLLLSCLEEAMKRNGDVRLAAIPQTAMAILERNGLDRLFTIFATSADAANSFQRLPHHALSHAPALESAPQNSENAA